MAYGACDRRHAGRAQRVIYIIGPDGKILKAFENVKAEDHPEALLTLLYTSMNLLSRTTSPAGASMPHMCSCNSATDERVKILDTQPKEINNAYVEASRQASPEDVTSKPPVYALDAEPDFTPSQEALTSRSIVPVTEAPPGQGAPPSVTPHHVYPAQNSTLSSMVYALGTMGCDFGTEARRDSIMQHMGEGAMPHDYSQLLAYLENNPWDAASIFWTLNSDVTPIYVIQPQGPFASEAYHRLRQFLREQLTEGVERVSIAGVIVGQTRLMTGQVVPVISPELRCMYSWTTAALINAICGESPTDIEEPEARDAYAQSVMAVTNFLERVYYELRNLGLSPQERAINYAATNAMNAVHVFESAMREEMELDTIEVERSPFCRPDSDCWDVKLTFFNPGRVFEQARKVYRFTIDVSDVCPVAVGSARSWYVR